MIQLYSPDRNKEMASLDSTSNRYEAPSALMIGTGEYTTGYVHGKQSGSDKKIGVIAVSLFDMRNSRRGEFRAAISSEISKSLNSFFFSGTIADLFPNSRTQGWGHQNGRD